MIITLSNVYQVSTPRMAGERYQAGGRRAARRARLAASVKLTSFVVRVIIILLWSKSRAFVEASSGGFDLEFNVWSRQVCRRQIRRCTRKSLQDEDYGKSKNESDILSQYTNALLYITVSYTKYLYNAWTTEKQSVWTTVISWICTTVKSNAPKVLDGIRYKNYRKSTKHGIRYMETVGVRSVSFRRYFPLIVLCYCCNSFLFSFWKYIHVCLNW